MRPACEVLMYRELSGKSWENVIRLLPAKTCAPTPIRTTGLFDHASARRMSLIAPRTRFRSVRVTVSVGAPTTWTRVRLVSVERSRNNAALRPAVHEEHIGSIPPTTGKRAVVVLALPLPAVTLRNSGEY